MKKIIIIIALFIFSVSAFGQELLDSTVVTKYNGNDSTPQLKMVYQHNLWGKTISYTAQSYDDYDEAWYNLALINYIYQNQRLIEKLQSYWEADAWIEGWRHVYTYPEINQRKKEFYYLEEQTERKGWEVLEKDTLDYEINSSVSFVDETTGNLNEKFRRTVVTNANGYTAINSRIGINGQWEQYHMIDHIVQNGLVTQKILKSYFNNVWTNVERTVFTYENQRLVEHESYAWQGNDWSTIKHSGQKYFYNPIVINPPELDQQNIIVLSQQQDELWVKSKVALEYISVYSLDEQLVYRNNKPKKTEIVMTDVEGEFYIEVVTKDNRKKIERFFIN